MSNFCKVFETEHGQVLVKIDKNDEEIPEVRYYISPEGLGVCSVAISFTDDDAGWDLAEKAFAKSDEAFALGRLRPLLLMLEQANVDSGV